jgi:predicted PurR-regulated permease PerM
MSGSDDKPKGSLFDAIRDRSRTVTTETSAAVPQGLRIATAYSWRFLVLAAAIGVAVWLVIQLKLLVIPLLVAILITALLWPAFSWLLRHRVPRWLAIVIAIVGTLAIVSGLLWLVVAQIIAQWPEVQKSTAAAIEQFRQYLISGPLDLTEDQIDGWLGQAGEFLQQQAELLWTGALAIGTTIGHVATGAVLALFILLCLLADGAGIWRWTLKRFP